MTKIVNDYDKEIKHFADAMRYKLHVNRKKGKWEGVSLQTLFDLLRKEVDELEEAITDGNQVAVMLEAADIGNFAMMIANVATKIATGEHFEPRNIVISNVQPMELKEFAHPSGVREIPMEQVADILGLPRPFKGDNNV